MRELNPISMQHEAVFRELVEMSVDLDSYRSLIEATTGQEMSSLEWTALLLLLSSSWG